MATKQPPNREKFDYLFKILLLGDSGVGKTSVMWRFSDDVFTSTYISTIGIDFKLRTMDVKGKRIRLQVWDTAGQERFHAISISYYRAAVGIMLVYDITRRFSFENIAKWLRNIEEHAKQDIVKLLIGNKCDMQCQRVVQQEEGEKLAQEYDMLFFETSAKIDVNIDVAFQSVTEEIMKRFVPEFRKPDRDEPEKECLVGIKKNTCSSPMLPKKETRCC